MLSMWLWESEKTSPPQRWPKGVCTPLLASKADSMVAMDAVMDAVMGGCGQGVGPVAAEFFHPWLDARLSHGRKTVQHDG